MHVTRREFNAVTIKVSAALFFLTLFGCNRQERPLNSGPYLDTDMSGNDLQSHQIYLDSRHHAVVDTIAKTSKLGNDISVTAVITTDLKNPGSPRQIIQSSKLIQGFGDGTMIGTIQKVIGQSITFQDGMLGDGREQALENDAYLFLIPDSFGNFPNAISIHGEGMSNGGSVAISPFLNNLPKAHSDFINAPFATAYDYIEKSIGAIPNWPSGTIMIYGSQALVDETVIGLQTTNRVNLSNHIIDFDFTHNGPTNDVITIADYSGSQRRKKIISTLQSTTSQGYPWVEVETQSSQNQLNLKTADDSMINRRQLLPTIVRIFTAS